mmetsp:Transcript_21931/g.41529  ORF Transcript_21931/g.41529 Transcript_21931/m.41529 type:complete len:425 (+) Transcript_21931:146-1420(+)
MNKSLVASLTDPPMLLQQTQDALQRLDSFETQEYREATEVVPGLVERETPIPIFLRGLDYDPLRAARHLARIWKYRKVLFGERWLLPMTQTGTGALTDMDIQFVRTGFAFLIPRPHSGPVVAVDMCKVLDLFPIARASGYDTQRLMERLGIYMCACFGDEFSKGPAVLFHYVTSNPRPEMEIRRQFWDMVHTAFPGRLAEVVVVQRYEENKQELLDFLRYQTARVLHSGTQIEPYEINEVSITKTLQLLENAGISRDCIPTELGGRFPFDAKVTEWIRARHAIESFLGPVPSALPKQQIVMKVFGKPKASPHEKVPLVKHKAHEGQTKKEYHLERNRVYSRRHLQKQNLELLSLKDQKRYLETQKQALLFQNLQLEYAIDGAKELVALHHQQIQDQKQGPCEPRNTWAVEEHVPVNKFWQSYGS